MVAQCCRKHGTRQEEGEGEQINSSYSLIHWKTLKHFQVQARRNLLVRLQSKQWQNLLYNLQFWRTCDVSPPCTYILPTTALSICFSSSSTAPKSSGASETWAGVKRKKQRSQQTKLWDVFQFFIRRLWEVDIGIWAYQALFQNRQTAGMPSSASVPAFLALWFSSHSFFSWFLLLRFSKLGSEP